jgi:glycosyltransferase involved in cell wall biosynthesis
MPTPAVSIILPTFNGSRYLREAVESCLSQTYGRWELIIVDDASTDATPGQIAELLTRDSRIRHVRHEQNRRLPGALSTGFSLARGHYLTWTSDDNCYRNHALWAMVSFLDSRPHVDAVYADCSMIDEQGRLVRRRRVGPTPRLVFGNVIGACFLYRRAVYDRLGDYCDDLFLAEDYDYWLRASRYFRLEPLHEDLYRYRLHRESLSSRREEDVARATERCFERNLPNLAWADKRSLQRRFLRLACEAKERGDSAIWQKWLRRAVWISPLGLIRSAGRLGYLLTPRSVLRGARLLSRRPPDRCRRTPRPAGDSQLDGVTGLG